MALYNKRRIRYSSYDSKRIAPQEMNSFLVMDIRILPKTFLPKNIIRSDIVMQIKRIYTLNIGIKHI